MADQDQKLSSIAFPALGTGILQYPADLVAKLMIESVIDYATQNPSCTLNEVVVVLYHQDLNTQKVSYCSSYLKLVHDINMDMNVDVRANLTAETVLFWLIIVCSCETEIKISNNMYLHVHVLFENVHTFLSCVLNLCLSSQFSESVY